MRSFEQFYVPRQWAVLERAGALVPGLIQHCDLTFLPRSAMVRSSRRASLLPSDGAGERVAGSPVEEIKARLDVADLVGQSVALKRSGRSFKGLCPFHGEKTPSFYVFPETGTWKCFGCGEGGDVFTFVQKRDNLEFVEALQSLAQRAGVELPERTPRQPEEVARDERLQSLLAQAELYFRGALDGLVGASCQRLPRAASNQPRERRAVRAGLCTGQRPAAPPPDRWLLRR